MNILRKLFPYSFNVKKDVWSVVVNVLVYVALGTLAALIAGALSAVPFLGILLSLVAGVFGIYVAVGAILSVLDYLKLTK